MIRIYLSVIRYDILHLRENATYTLNSDNLSDNKIKENT